MRTRTGHRPEDWTENQPAEPLPPKGYAGSLVVGGPGSTEAQRQSAKRSRLAAAARLAAGVPPPAPKPRADRSRFYATDEERIEARRRSFRESKIRARQRVA